MYLVVRVCQHDLRTVWAHLDMVGMLGFVSLDINQISLPTPFYSALGIYFCLYSPFNCISFFKFSLSSDIICSGWLGWKHQQTNYLRTICGKTLKGITPCQISLHGSSKLGGVVTCCTKWKQCLIFSHLSIVRGEQIQDSVQFRPYPRYHP